MATTVSGFDGDSLLDDVLGHAEGRRIVQTYLAGVVNSPLLVQLRHLSLERIAGTGAFGRLDPPAAESFWSELASLDRGVVVPRVEAPAIVPSTSYEPIGTPPASLSHPPTADLWDTVELTFDGPSHGNPFVDVDLVADFSLDGDGDGRGDEPVTVGGFYDGDGRFLLRFQP
ncbi:MAG: hypothetical protein JWP75_724, partial [Frondihabitans sp.]|nr:hypothetical protein [Frondihabitans sp.]